MSSKTISLPQDRYERSAVCRRVAYNVRTLPLQERRQWLEHLRRSVNNVKLSYRHADYLHELQDFLTWDEVRELRKFGVDIGCHTVSHPVLADLPPNELHDELQLSKVKIEQELGGECNTLAYPFGSSSDYSEAVISKVKELGFRLAFTLTNKRNDLSSNGTSSKNPLEIHRLCITRDLTLHSFKAVISGIRGK